MKKGYFGEFGGCFVPELLMPPLLEVEAAMRDIMPTQQFQDELQDLLHNYAGRPTPLTFCPRLSEELGFELWLKREDLLHSGAHKINNTLGQALLAKYMGKTALVAETGAGQHGVATAVAAAITGRATRKSEIVMDGGTLHIEWNEADNHVYLSGPAAFAFEGEVALPQ